MVIYNLKVEEIIWRQKSRGIKGRYFFFSLSVFRVVCCLRRENKNKKCSICQKSFHHCLVFLFRNQVGSFSLTTPCILFRLRGKSKLRDFPPVDFKIKSDLHVLLKSAHKIDFETVNSLTRVRKNSRLRESIFIDFVCVLLFFLLFYYYYFINDY